MKDTNSKFYVNVKRRTTFVAPNVAAKIGDEGEDAIFIEGVLKIVEKTRGIFLEWCAGTDADLSNDWVLTTDDDETVAASSSPPRADSKTADINKKFAFSVDIADLRSFYCHEYHAKKNPGDSWIRLMAKDGTGYVPLYFRGDADKRRSKADEDSLGVSKFITALQKYATLKRSAREQNLILFTDDRKEALEKSIVSLFDKEEKPFFQKFANNPFGTAVSSLTKVSAMVNNHLYDAFVDDSDGVDVNDQKKAVEEMMRLDFAARDDADHIVSRPTADGFEDVSYQKLDFPKRPAIEREQPMSLEKITSEFIRADNGALKETRHLRQLIARAGLEPSARRRMWPYLLGQYAWHSTSDERVDARKRQTDDYYRMKLQWKSITDDQESRFTQFSNFKSLVEKDVARTDRTLAYFKGADNTHAAMLNDILMTYVMHNFNLGYVQGMSDFASVILYVLDDEIDAFWCFVGLMDKHRLCKNFEEDQAQIRHQLMQLATLLAAYNPKLYNYLESESSENMYFCFRWILVRFKREFSFANIQRLWEVLWTDMPCKNFHLLICVAILDRQMKLFMDNHFGLSEILKHINDLSGHIDVGEVLASAEAIYHQFNAIQNQLDTPYHAPIVDILGFDLDDSGSSSSADGSPARKPL